MERTSPRSRTSRREIVVPRWYAPAAWLRRCPRARRARARARRAPLGEALDEQPVPEAAVADRERVRGRACRARCGRCSAPARITSARFGWRPTIVAPLLGVARPVELDLAVDLGAVEHRALDDVGVVASRGRADGGQVRHGAAHPDERVGPRPPVEPSRSAAIAVERRASTSPRRRVEPEALGEARGADIDAEALLDRGAVPERELRAAAAGVEDDDASRRPSVAAPAVAAR